MATLAALKLSAAVKPTHMPVIQVRRNKLIKRLWEQIQLARAQAESTQFALTKFCSITDEDGHRRSVEMPRRVRAWWWTTDTNKLALNFRYGASKLEISKGKSAVEAGELDAQIEAAAVKLCKGFGK
jgi:hypothetical protein